MDTKIHKLYWNVREIKLVTYRIFSGVIGQTKDKKSFRDLPKQIFKTKFFLAKEVISTQKK